MTRYVSNGEIQAFKRCRRKWWLAWYRGLGPVHIAPVGARQLGTRVHRALAAWYVPEDQGPQDPRDALEVVLDEDRTALIDSHGGDETGNPEMLAAQLDDFDKEADLARAMVEGYGEWLGETGADADLEVIAPEQAITLELTDPDVTLLGRLDVRLRRVHDGARLFMDHKAQPLDSLVLTPGGWTTMGDIQTGDQVVTPDGSVAHVSGTYPQGVVPVYEVKFSDGTAVRSCDDHLWNVKKFSNRSDVQTLPLSKIRATFDAGPMPSGAQHSYRYYIPLIDGSLPMKSELPVDPYVLGVLLGDGGLAHGSVGFTTGDPDIAELIRDRIPSECYLTGPHDDGISYGICTGTRWIENPIRTYLRDHGLNVISHLKHVPDEYLWADDESRLALLRGLMDSDGHVGLRGQTIFASTSERLRDAVSHLARSLGGVVTCNEFDPHVPGPTTYIGSAAYSGRTVFSCNLQMTHSSPPFACERKLDRWARTRKTNPRRKIHDVRYVGDAETKCIMVDHPSHCYVTDHFTVTHNTVGDLTSPTKGLQQDEQLLTYHVLERFNYDAGERSGGALYNLLRKVKRTSRAKPPFYDRVEVHHNRHELNSFWRRLHATIEEVLGLERRLDNGDDPSAVAYPTPTKDCSWDCDFVNVCPMFDDGSRAEDMLAIHFTEVELTNRYPELAELSEETIA